MSKDIENNIEENDSIFTTDDNLTHSFRLHILSEAMERGFDNDINKKSPCNYCYN